MNDAGRMYPEVFTPAGPFHGDSGRTVYPPRPDADGNFAFIEVLDWHTLMIQVYVQTGYMCAFLRSALSSMSIESRNRIEESVRQIERTRPIFLRTGLLLIATQQRMKDMYMVFFIESMVWAQQESSLRMTAKFFAGSPDKWLALSQAVVENHLEGQKDWRHANEPAQWVKGVTNTIARKESRVAWQAVDRSEDPDVISLEEIVESTIEGLLEQQYSFQSVAQLEAAAQEDPETAEYLSCKIRNPSWSCDAISRHLNWDEKRGRRIDRRFRRLRRKIRNLGAGIQCRDYKPPVGISEANFTAHFEQLFDGTRGRGTGVWQHRTSD